MAALRVSAVTTLVALLGPSLTKVTAQNPGGWWPAAGTVMLAGGGLQYNRIAGPLTFQQYAAGVGNPIDGVMIARAGVFMRTMVLTIDGGM